MKRRLRGPSPALVIALIALFVALGGTSFAAINALPKNSVGAKQLKKNAVTGVKIKNKAVHSSQDQPERPHRPERHSRDECRFGHQRHERDQRHDGCRTRTIWAASPLRATLKNSGTIYVQQGHANWQPFASTDPVTITQLQQRPRHRQFHYRKPSVQDRSDGSDARSTATISRSPAPGSVSGPIPRASSTRSLSSRRSRQTALRGRAPATSWTIRPTVRAVRALRTRAPPPYHAFVQHPDLDLSRSPTGPRPPRSTWGA